MRWQWFTKPYRFQVFNSIKHHQHTASCAHHLKQSLFPSPLSPFAHLHWNSTLFPTDYHHAVVCVCVLYIYIFVVVIVCFCFLRNPFTFFIQSPSILPSNNCSKFHVFPTLLSYTFDTILKTRSHYMVSKMAIRENILMN